MAHILIVDDHPIVAEGLQRLIFAHKITSECNCVFSATECHRYLELFEPELVLLDYHLPDGNGIELCKYIKGLYPQIKIMVVSSFREQSIVKLVMECGAMGYVLKNASEEDIIDAVQTVLSGKIYMCDDSRDIINNRVNQTIITDREIEVLKLIANGNTNFEIAEKLFLSPLTVERHRKNIILKLNAKNTASLISIATHQGYI